jgi:hypothetical protein
MAQRFTDSEKWNDPWFSELSNDHKVVWIYLLDYCNNAGIFKLNLKLINYNCNTNLTVEEFIRVFKKRITIVNEETYLINKFCQFQYGVNFLDNRSKPIMSAIKKLVESNLVTYDGENYYWNEKQNTTPTLIKGLDNPLERVNKDLGKSQVTTKDKDKDKDKEQVKEEVKEEVKVQVEDRITEEMKSIMKKYERQGWNSLSPKEAAIMYKVKDILNNK